MHANFFQLNFKVQLQDNLLREELAKGSRWNLIFVVVMDCIWSKDVQDLVWFGF